jgi:Fibronectin type III domain
VTGLTNGTSYTFTVTATNALGSTAGTASASKLIATAPAAVSTSLSGSLGSYSATLNWSAGATNGSAITGFEVQYSTVSDFSSGVTVVTGIASSTLSYYVGSMPSSPTYFRVRAINAIGSGGWSGRTANWVQSGSSYQYQSGTSYSCPSGGTLSGTTCTQPTYTTYTCTNIASTFFSTGQSRAVSVKSGGGTVPCTYNYSIVSGSGVYSYGYQTTGTGGGGTYTATGTPVYSTAYYYWFQ